MWIEETKAFINSFTNFQELAIALAQLDENYQPSREYASFRILSTLQNCIEYDGGLKVNNEYLITDVKTEKNQIWIGYRNAGTRWIKTENVYTYEWIEPTQPETIDI
ncbi:hypothetical protein ELBI_61 [Anabaena phage Elbi]|nr:hypothetical protein ELBI_61 [Anabaena phage Elbi]